MVRGADGKLATARNKAIGAAGDPAHAPFSDEQAKLTQDAFYARMGKLINPQGLEAEAAYRETLDALAEQLTVRVGSVDNGEKFQKEKGPAVIPMPDGAKIFETTGPWEDYATPSRDMRLLIAMNVLLGMPRADRQAPRAFQAGRPEAGGGARRDRQAARQPHPRPAASPTSAAMARRKS